MQWELQGPICRGRHDSPCIGLRIWLRVCCGDRHSACNCSSRIRSCRGEIPACKRRHHRRGFGHARRGTERASRPHLCFMEANAVDLVHDGILAVLFHQLADQRIGGRLLCTDLGGCDARPGELQRRIPAHRIFAHESVVVVIRINGRVDLLQRHSALAGIAQRHVLGNSKPRQCQQHRRDTRLHESLSLWISTPRCMSPMQRDRCVTARTRRLPTCRTLIDG